MRRTIMMCVMMSAAGPAIAQDAATRTAEINSQTALTQAQTSRINAEAELARTRVSSPGLPNFQDKATLEGDAGKMETMQMASYALADAAAIVAPELISKRTNGQADPTKSSTILLTATEPFDLSLADSIKFELDYLVTDLNKAVTAADAAIREGNLRKPTPNPKAGAPEKTLASPDAASASAALVGAAATANPIALAVAGIGAVAGLIRTETTVTGFGMPEMDDAMFVRAVAAAKPDYFTIPGALAVTQTTAPLLANFLTASRTNDIARQRRNDITAAGSKAPTDTAKTRIAELELAIVRFEAFQKRVTTANAAGRLPIIDAARSDMLRGHDVARVHIDRAGGSLVNTKNIATFFGADPIKVTAGLVVSFVMSNPESGLAGKAGMVTCRTAMTRLRQVQEGRYRTRLPAATTRSETGPLAFCKAFS